MKTLGIIGAGWLGIRLAHHFRNQYEIHVTTRTADKFDSLQQHDFHPTLIQFTGEEVQSTLLPWSLLPNIDVLIVTVNFSKRTAIDVLSNRFENINRYLKSFNQQMFLMSSIGIYPQVEGLVEEDTLPDTALQPNIWSVEQLMRKHFPQINILRLGGLMGDDRYLSKYKISEPAQVANHIHYEDIALVIDRMIQLELHGKTYNIVTPEHPPKQAILDQQLGHTASTPVPEPFGRIVSSKKMQTELAYTYTHPDPRFFK